MRTVLLGGPASRRVLDVQRGTPHIFIPADPDEQPRSPGPFEDPHKMLTRMSPPHTYEAEFIEDRDGFRVLIYLHRCPNWCGYTNAQGTDLTALDCAVLAALVMSNPTS